MDTINNDLTNLLQQMGVHKESLGITQRIVIIAGILIIAFVADYFCRKIVVPTIKKLTARTQATWDDYLFNDAVLDNMCHLIPPIILYVLLPFAFPHEPVTLTFILKLCWVYITAVAMKLICSFLTIRLGRWKLVASYYNGQQWELYDIAHDRTEQHNLIGKYPEMAKELETAYFEWADKSDVLYFQKMWNTYNKNRRKDFKEYKTR